MKEVIIILFMFLVIATICFFLFKFFTRPYTEEVIKEVEVTNGSNSVIRTVYHIRRTYKDGTVKIIRKEFSNGR